MIQTVSLVGRQHSVKACKISDRHRAYVLQDTAYSMVRNEMDTEFGRLCEQIKESHEKRGTCFNAKDIRTTPHSRISQLPSRTKNDSTQPCRSSNVKKVKGSKKASKL